MLSLTEVEHVRRRDEGHEENPRGERHHADQDEHHVAEAATKHDDAEETGEENHAAGGVPITHLEEDRKWNEYRQDEYTRYSI